MKIRIHQINSGRDAARVRFISYDSLSKFQGTQDINAGIYDTVYTGELDCEGLEDVYRALNTDHPAAYSGRSLSVSDIVEVISGGNIQPGFYYCDSYGFKTVQFDPEKTAKRKTISVVLLEQGKLAQTVEIDASLKGMQRVVNGHIEISTPFVDEKVLIVCNDCHKQNGMPFNRAVRGEKLVKNEKVPALLDFINGPFFIVAGDGEELISLSPEQLRKYSEIFKYPEQLVMVNGELRSSPYKPVTRVKRQQPAL